MKLTNCLWVAIIFFALPVRAQIYNDGATITVTTGGLLFSQGDLQNVNGGTITNNGRIEVQANFTNSATYNTTTADDSLIFTGGSTSVLSPGTASISNLTINKAAGIKVNLGSNATVTNRLDYTQGILTTNPSTTTFVLSSPVAAVYNIATGREIIGRVRRTGWANGSAVPFNNSNMSVTTNGGTAPSDITVNMIPNSEGGDPSQTEREVKRTFQFAYTGGTGFTADVKFPYVAGDLNTNVEANLIPWKLNGAEWIGRANNITRNAANDFVLSSGIPADTLLQEWKLADPFYSVTTKAFLRGAWNSGTGLMNTTLNTAGIIPLSQPFNTAPFNYAGTESVAAIPANVVDWVLVEVRKPSTGLAPDAGSSTITGRKALFLLNNGNIVDLDGVSSPNLPIYKQGNGNYIAVRHRNHLGMLSNTADATSTGIANDFSLLSNVYKSSSASSDPVVALTSSTNFGMWTGDVIGSTGAGSVNSSDLNSLKSAISNLLTGYLRADVNLSNSINSADLNLVKSTIASLGSTSTPLRLTAQSMDKEVSSSLPE
jgi:hypothetical protein